MPTKAGAIGIARTDLSNSRKFGTSFLHRRRHKLSRYSFNLYESEKKMNSREKLIQRTMDVQREITQAGLKRRDLLKMGLLSAGTGMLLPISGLSMRAAWAAGGADDALGSIGACPVPGVDLISPFTRPWIEELPSLVEKQTVLNNNPANISIG